MALTSKSLDLLEFTGLDMQFKWNRLFSLKAFKSQYVKPEALADNGFFYYGQGDTVECYMCGINLGFWSEGDDPKVEHTKFAPDCPMNSDGNDIHEPEQVRQNKPGFPNYADIQKRYESFEIWPPVAKELVHPLADAGFFYTGSSDATQCFYCSVILNSWQVDDDPWEKHADAYPYCKYVEIIKGLDYIVNIKFSKNHNTELNTEPVKIPIMISTEETDELKDLCKICKKNEKNYLFKKCGHIAVCQDCLPSDKICPVCHLPYEKEIKIYYS